MQHAVEFIGAVWSFALSEDLGTIGLVGRNEKDKSGVAVL